MADEGCSIIRAERTPSGPLRRTARAKELQREGRIAPGPGMGEERRNDEHPLQDLSALPSNRAAPGKTMHCLRAHLIYGVAGSSPHWNPIERQGSEIPRRGAICTNTCCPRREP